MNQKTLFIIIALIAIFSVAGGVIYFSMNKNSGISSVSQSSSDLIEEEQLDLDKQYINSEFGFSFFYPSKLDFRVDEIGGSVRDIMLGSKLSPLVFRVMVANAYDRPETQNYNIDQLVDSLNNNSLSRTRVLEREQIKVGERLAVQEKTLNTTSNSVHLVTYILKGNNLLMISTSGNSRPTIDTSIGSRPVRYPYENGSEEPSESQIKLHNKILSTFEFN